MKLFAASVCRSLHLNTQTEDSDIQSTWTG